MGVDSVEKDTDDGPTDGTTWDLTHEDSGNDQKQSPLPVIKRRQTFMILSGKTHVFLFSFPVRYLFSFLLLDM